MSKRKPIILLGIVLLGAVLFFAPRILHLQNSNAYQPKTRTYYISAEDTEWDYAPLGKDPMTNEPLPKPWGEQTKYKKVRYFEYTDATFSQKKAQPVWLGILGPIIRGVEGDTIKVVFWNKAKKPYSMHPHGLLYDKDNEGASMPGIDMGGKGDMIQPGENYTYTWKVRKEAAPQEDEGGSKIWVYHSHVDAVADIYEGLIGPIIITSASHVNSDGTPNDVDKEFVTLFMIFNESTDKTPKEQVMGNLKHTINGYIFDNLQGLEMKKGDKVRWHLIGMGAEVDLHTPHWHGEVVKENGHYIDVVDLLPATMKTVDMLAENVGEWMYHCHVSDHITAGMVSSYTIMD